MEFSKLVLINLFHNKEYTKKVTPYIKKEFFNDYVEGYIFSLFKSYLSKHRSFPSEVSFKIELNDTKKLNESNFKLAVELVDEIFKSECNEDFEWLVTKTEEWCKERAVYNALLKSIELHEERKNLDGIPEILREALRVSFNKECGLELFDDKCISDRMKTYRKKIKKYPTGISKLDMICDGGFENKAVSIFFGASGAGKSATLVAVSANMAVNGEDVLYVTLEMAEEKITQRYEANYLDEKINDIKDLDEIRFKDDLLKIKSNNVGRIIVKEFPPATINIEHIRSLLDELEIKKNFKPTVIVIDYINLMKSSRFTGDNMYSTVKSIVEEVRGLAVERELCIISATQANKDGNSSKVTDLDATNVGESKGIVDTTDFLCALIYPEELREKNIQIWKVLKNRYGGSVNYKIPVKVEHDKSKVYDLDDDDFILNSNPEKNEPKRKKQPLNLKFESDNLDEGLFDD